MTWIKLEDKAPRHPKIAGLSDRAFRVWINSLCYASEFLTDGLLPSVFLISVKAVIRQELLACGLWEMSDDGARVSIHDYLQHQTARQSVERHRDKARDRSEKVRGKFRETSQKVSVPDTDTETDTEVRTQTTAPTPSSSVRSAPLIVSPLKWEQKRRYCAFVGSRLEVPNALHERLRRSLGGPNAHADLLMWYEDLNSEIEESGEAIHPDIFGWMDKRYAAWTVAAGRAKVAGSSDPVAVAKAAYAKLIAERKPS